MQRKTRLRNEWRITAMASFALLAIFIFFNITRDMGNVVYDHFMRLHGFTPSEDIIILAIDDRSLQELGGWPLKRSQYEKLFRLLDDDRYRPKAIGVDLLFIDATADDVALAHSMRALPTVLPLEFKIQDTFTQGYLPTKAISPLNSAAKFGHINLSFDSDGVIRGFQTKDLNWPHFSLAMQARASSNGIQNDTAGYRRFRMVDPAIGFPVISLTDAIHQTSLLSLLQNKYVLLGVTAPSLSDRYPTLYAGRDNASTPGVAILASILNDALRDTLIQEASATFTFMCSSIGILVMLYGIMVLQPTQLLALSVMLILCAASISYALLTQNNYWIDPSPLVLLTIFIHPLWAWRRLEAMLEVIRQRTSDLHSLKKTDSSESIGHTEHEFVLKHGALLDHAINFAKTELEFLSLIIDQIPDAIAVFDQSDRLLLANQQLHELIDFKDNVSTLDAIASAFNLPINTLIAANPLGHADSHIHQATTQLGRIDFYIKHSRITTHKGRHLRLVIWVDVTELRQSQRQRDRALQLLSHDMRTPIASIMAITQRQTTVALDSKKIRSHALAALHMMDDFILGIASEVDQYALKEELLDNIIHDTVENVSDLAIEKNIQIHLSHSTHTTPFVRANVRLLVRALVNLFVNAIKFSPTSGEITIHIRTDSITNKVTLKISNQVEITNATVHRTGLLNFGLGLDFVNTVIQKHGGKLSHDFPNQGKATVQIELPCFAMAS